MNAWSGSGRMFVKTVPAAPFSGEFEYFQRVVTYFLSPGIDFLASRFASSFAWVIGAVKT